MPRSRVEFADLLPRGRAKRRYFRPSSLARPFSISANLPESKRPSLRSILLLSTPATPIRFTTEVCLSQGGLGKLTSHSPFLISVVIGTTTDMLRWLSAFGMETTTAGLTLACIPKSTATTSPRLKLIIINVRGRPQLLPGVHHDGRSLRQGRQGG